MVLPQLRSRGHARQTDPDASRLRAKTQAQTDAQTGLPRPGHGSGGLGSPGNPRFPSESVRHLVPARSSYQSRPRSHEDCESPGLSKIPGGEVTSQWGDAIRPGAHRHSVYPDSAPWCCSASGVRDPRREAVRGAAAQGRGAKAAAIASHVRRLKLYPEPQTWGGGGYRAGWEALSFRPAPIHPPTNDKSEAGP